MHNDDMQVHYNLVCLDYNPRRDHMCLAYYMMNAHTSRRDHMSIHMMNYSRDRSRRRT